MQEPESNPEDIAVEINMQEPESNPEDIAKAVNATVLQSYVRGNSVRNNYIIEELPKQKQKD